jgi:thiamine-phosphate pyrophosphorylase
VTPRAPTAAARPAPRLYLATPPLADTAAGAVQWPALLAAADVAAVLLRLAPADERTLIKRVKALAPQIQPAGVALLVDGHPDLVARSGADGAHLSGTAALEAALPVLKPERIAGVGGLASRHDAMVAGEAGADYLLFGDTDADGHRAPAAAIAERIQWWAEVFQPPCVGAAATRDEARAFAAAGAEFILLGDAVWAAPDPLVALREIATAIGAVTSA